MNGYINEIKSSLELTKCIGKFSRYNFLLLKLIMNKRNNGKDNEKLIQSYEAHN